jgi:hypothetical protein
MLASEELRGIKKLPPKADVILSGAPATVRPGTKTQAIISTYQLASSLLKAEKYHFIHHVDMKALGK